MEVTVLRAIDQCPTSINYWFFCLKDDSNEKCKRKFLHFFSIWGSHCHVSQLSAQTLGRANMAKQSCLLLREWTSLKHEKCSDVASDFVFWVQPLRVGILSKQVL